MDTLVAGLDIHRIQYVALLGTVAFLVFLVELIRKQRIKEAYAILWLVFGLVFLGLSVFRESLNWLAFAFGIAYPPAFLFLVSIVAFVLILIQFSVVISSQNDRIRELSQEIALATMADAPAVAQLRSRRDDGYQAQHRSADSSQPSLPPRES